MHFTLYTDKLKHSPPASNFCYGLASLYYSLEHNMESTRLQCHLW